MQQGVLADTHFSGIKIKNGLQVDISTPDLGAAEGQTPQKGDDEVMDWHNVRVD